MHGRRPATPAILVAMVLLLAAGCASAPPVRPTSIASGASGGIYQPIAATIARVARETPGLNLPLTVETTGASVANVQLLSEGGVQLALVQNDIAYYGFQGTTLPAFRARARSNLRAIMSLYPEYVQIVASQASGATSVSEFRGKRVALGPEGSGTEQNALQVLEACGVRVTDLGQAPRIDTAEAVTRMKAGQLDGAFFTVGAGSPLVGDLLADGRAHLVAVARAQMLQIQKKSPFYWIDDLNANTYPSQTAAVATPSLRVLLMTTENAQEDVVYGLTKALVDNIPALRAAHPAVSSLSPETVRRGVTVPIHPGALRLYRERNIQQ